MSQNLFGWKWIAVVCVVVAGCGDTSAGEPDLTRTEEGLGTECARALPTATFEHGLSVSSPRSYNTKNCYKAQVYDVTTYVNAIGGGPGVSASTVVSWGDTVPTVANCPNAWVASDLFSLSSFDIPAYVGSRSAYGSVVDGECVPPSLTWGTDVMRAGLSWRI